MTIAVVILNWNGHQLLEQFLPSIIQFSDNAIIYVADNASTDNSIEFLKTNFPTVQIIQNKKNYGYAKGYNEALKSVSEDIYALVNSDILVTKNWLKPILECFENEEETAIVQPKILDFKQQTNFEYAGAAGGFIDQYGYPYCRGRIFDTIEKDENQYQNEKIFWASGACFFIRKEVFEVVNGFDSDFFAHQEEIDLCWRTYNLLWATKYIANSVVYHVGGATLNASNPQKTYLNFRNSLWMLVKNLPKEKFYKILFSRMVLDGLAGIQFLYKFKIRHFFAILHAHFSFYCKFIKMYKKRGEEQRISYYRTKSIVYQYFILKNNVFKKITK